MTDGLDAVREVATHWRRRYQAAQALLAETQRELDTAKDALFVVTSIKNRALDERDEARRRIAELEATVANLDPRIARLERITPPAPIQGVEDMYFTGESCQTEDE